MAILVRSDSSISATAHSVKKIKSLKTLEEITFASQSTEVKHSEKGSTSTSPYGNTDTLKGRYYGYIAAVVIDNKIVEIKSVPNRYEQDLPEAKKLLKISVP